MTPFPGHKAGALCPSPGIISPLLEKCSNVNKQVLLQQVYILHSRLLSCLIATAFQQKVKRECTHALLSLPLSKPSEVCTEQEGRENWNYTFLQDHGLETFEYKLPGPPTTNPGPQPTTTLGTREPLHLLLALSLVVSTDSRPVSSKDCARPSVKRTQLGFCPGLSQ